jgi:hypothetical protein
MPQPEPWTDVEPIGTRYVDGESDERIVNNAMRHQYRVLNDDEKEAMLWIKDQGQTMIDFIDANTPKGREASIAKTKIEEAVMWAVKGLTQ